MVERGGLLHAITKPNKQCNSKAWTTNEGQAKLCQLHDIMQDTILNCARSYKTCDGCAKLVFYPNRTPLQKKTRSVRELAGKHKLHSVITIKLKEGI